jgi:CubicO group peptidase (beta-lactamase class C family)
MKKLLFLLITISLSYTVISQNTDKRFDGLDKELNEVLTTWKAAGFAVAVVEKDKVIYAKGFGYKDYENKKPVTANTLFSIGSCTKAFTTSLLGILRNEDKLSFDDKPSKYIPGFKFYNEDMDNMITIKDMMSHRTGLPRHDFSWYLFPTKSKDSLVQRIAFQEPFTGVREKWYYNNFMFLTQGVITEKITGKSWEENIKSKLFKPLGMVTANVSIDELKQSKDAAFGYELKKDSIIKKMDYYRISGMSPAGSINSSVNEMSNWLITWINGGKYKDKEILPAQFVSEAQSSQMVVSGGVPGKLRPELFLSNYGYGWFNSSYKGHYRVQHGGNIDGFSANTCFFPSDSIGIVVLANQDGSSVPSVVRNLIADRVLKLKQTDWNKDLKEEQEKAIKEQKEAKKLAISNQKKGTKTSHILEEFAGEYSHPGYGKFKLKVVNDSLFAKFPLVKLWLKHYHYDIFVPYVVEDSKIDTTDNITSELRWNFITNDAGEISGVKAKFEAALDPLTFKRKAVEIKIDKAILNKYVGEYNLSTITTKVSLKGEKIYLLVPGQPEYELFPTASNKFTLKALDGYKLEFIKNEKGEFNELLFIQPNGTFKAKRKEN